MAYSNQHEAFEALLKSALPGVPVFQANMPFLKMDELARAEAKTATYLFYKDTERVNTSGASGVTWTTGKGLFFPATIKQYVTNTTLMSLKETILTCAFGYSDMSTGALVTSGTTLDAAATTNPKYLLAKGSVHDSGGNPTYLNSAIPQSASTYYPKYNANVTERGCLSCDWSAYKMWRDGLAQSMTNNKSSYPTYNAGWTTGRVFTTTTQTNSTIVRGTMYLSALVFYNCTLTDTQHAQLAEQINAL